MSDPLVAIKQLAGDLIGEWLKSGAAPSEGVEAMTPQLQALLGGPAASFEDYQHRDHVRPDWGFMPFHLERFFEAPWEFYLPVEWRIEPAEDGMSATVLDANGKRQQAIQPTHRDRHPADIDWIFGAGTLLGFEFGRDGNDFLHWRFVTQAPDRYNVFGVFTAGEYGVLVVGFAANTEELKRQLESSMTSIPWYHWMTAE